MCSIRAFFTLTATAVLTLGAFAAPAAAQARPSSQAAKALAVISINAWTCSQHPAVRMADKGTCPMCEKELVRTKLALQGAGAKTDLYTLTTCSVCEEALGAKPVILAIEEREVRFCCGDCAKTFQADAAAYLQKLDKQIIEKQAVTYAITTCPVSGETLGSMGDPVDYVYNNRLIRFCCGSCVKAFKKDPAPTLAKLDEQVLAAQRANYPVEICVVSGQKLGGMGEPVDYVVGNRLVRFCCGSCPAAFFKDPAKYLAKLDAAKPVKPGEQPKGGAGN